MKIINYTEQRTQQKKNLISQVLSNILYPSYTEVNILPGARTLKADMRYFLGVAR